MGVLPVCCWLCPFVFWLCMSVKIRGSPYPLPSVTAVRADRCYPCHTASAPAIAASILLAFVPKGTRVRGRRGRDSLRI